MKHLTYILAFLLVSTSSFSHDGKKHKKDTTKAPMDSTMNMGDTTQHHNGGMQIDKLKVTADLDDFPTLHPLIVHFPIILLLIAAAIQAANVYFGKKEFDWIVTALVFVGALTAWLASNNFHPHTEGLSEHAKLVLTRHEFWADWTVYLSVAGCIAQAVNQFVLNQKKWATVAVALILAGSAFSVSMAGHHGAQLAYIEGIGPMGKFLSNDHNEDDMGNMGNKKMDSTMKMKDRMPGMDTMDNMKGKGSMKNMQDMKTPSKNPMDTFRFEDNNPAWQKRKRNNKIFDQ